LETGNSQLETGNAQPASLEARVAKFKARYPELYQAVRTLAETTWQRLRVFVGQAEKEAKELRETLERAAAGTLGPGKKSLKELWREARDRRLAQLPRDPIDEALWANYQEALEKAKAETRKREAGSKKQEQGSQKPEGGGQKQKSEAGSQKPEGGAQKEKSEAGSQKPEAGSKNPEGGAQKEKSEVSNQKSESATGVPPASEPSPAPNPESPIPDKRNRSNRQPAVIHRQCRIPAGNGSMGCACSGEWNA
jgi:hypothetical protein